LASTGLTGGQQELEGGSYLADQPPPLARPRSTPETGLHAPPPRPETVARAGPHRPRSSSAARPNHGHHAKQHRPLPPPCARGRP
jgi:hypothetical protein